MVDSSNSYNLVPGLIKMLIMLIKNEIFKLYLSDFLQRGPDLKMSGFILVLKCFYANKNLNQIVKIDFNIYLQKTNTQPCKGWGVCYYVQPQKKALEDIYRVEMLVHSPIFHFLCFKQISKCDTCFYINFFNYKIFRFLAFVTKSYGLFYIFFYNDRTFYRPVPYSMH